VKLFVDETCQIDGTGKNETHRILCCGSDFSVGIGSHLRKLPEVIPGACQERPVRETRHDPAYASIRQLTNCRFFIE
jgi:hypothetical protein